MRKPVFGVCDQVRTPICAATETRWRLENSDIAPRGNCLGSEQQRRYSDCVDAQADLGLCDRT